MDIYTEQLKKEIDERGFEYEDTRFNRKVKSISGHFLVIKELDEIKKNKLEEKYKKDWMRMYSYFKKTVKYCLEDSYSRRLVVFNNMNYKTNFQCFNLFQFVITANSNFDMYIYQRSADLAKFVDDVKFFGYVAKKFESRTKKIINKIVIIYGSVHYEIK